MNQFLAFEVTKTDNVFARGIVRKEPQTLPNKHVAIKVDYSDINYKDALASSKDGGVIREYPKIPGIDLAGEIIESRSEHWHVGQKVLVTGYGLGVSVNGGFSQYQQVPEEWLVALPDQLTTKEAMIFGTAGFTAALAVTKLLKDTPKDGRVVVTGASGGVGSVAIALLHRLGYTNITAVSRKKADVAWLKDLGATAIVEPEEILPEQVKPLNKQRIAAVIDSVGGDLLAGLLSQINYGGSVFLCGNAGGIQLNTTVLPFILRGIKMVGIDSVNVELTERKATWQFLAEHQPLIEQLHYQEVALIDLDEPVDALLAGTHQGRTIVQMEVR
ncbi:YhdH/YhfP family quinone oxidoreductase [Enterococcus saccharolyticus]|uniref:YhdH/YhfP family quinone oxidoreductase n=1 Tax=Enterococcus saccharolyticus TaxID=41997 RepID=UPI0039E025E6